MVAAFGVVRCRELLEQADVLLDGREQPRREPGLGRHRVVVAEPPPSTDAPTLSAARGDITQARDVSGQSLIPVARLRLAAVEAVDARLSDQRGERPGSD